MADETLIAEAGRRLADAAPGAQVILFGSHARGEARAGSDLDLIVAGADHVKRWGAVKGTLIHEALRDGRVIAGA